MEATINTDLIYSTPEQLEALTVLNGSLLWRGREGAEQVHAFCAFPLSYPTKQIVLRTSADVEVGIIEDLTVLEPSIREAIEQQLERRYFLPQIVKIYKMTERFGSAIWDLETDRGRVAISTRQLNEAVRELGPQRFLIIDVEGNRYEIKNISELPLESQRHFVGRG